MQPKSGCMAYTKMLVLVTDGVSPVITATQLSPPPAKKSATFESEGIHLSKEHKKQLRVLATQRDVQWRPCGDHSDNSWHSLLDQAQYLFHATALPIATYELLSACLIQQHVKYPSKHLLAKVLATAQK